MPFFVFIFSYDKPGLVFVNLQPLTPLRGTDIYEKYKQEALDAMLKYGVKSFDSEKVKMTLVPGGKSMRFDSTRFKKEQPDLYAQYLKESETKDSIRVTVRDNVQP